MRIFIISSILCFFSFVYNLAQTEKFLTPSIPSTKGPSNLIVINEIEDAIKNTDVNKLSKYINSKTYLSLMSYINGYYSTNQAFYLLEDFFRIHKVYLFKFTHFNLDLNNSYATGVLHLENKGRRSKAQVYVSLKRIGENWIISHLSIN